jgi:hypothetical protein
MTPLKYVLIVVVLSSAYALSFLSYPLPTLSDWLVWIFLACWIPLFIFSLSALLRRNWKAVAIFSATWVLGYLPFAEFEPVDRFRFWLSQQGFRIHASPVEDYLSKCRLTEFIEKGVRQTVGLCEVSGGAAITYFVFYDTTGEIALPLSQRTPEWKDAMWHYPPKGVLRDSEDRAGHLFGNFYRVDILATEFDGDSVE